MHRKKLGTATLASIAGLSLVGVSCGSASAALEAFDSAQNYTATASQPNTWSATPANEGSGFGAWSSVVSQPSGPDYAGTFLANKSSSSDSAIASANGYAWGFYANGANSNASINMYRPFDVNPSGYQDPSGLGTLINQPFSIEMQSSSLVSSPANFGFNLQTGQGTSPTHTDITLKFVGGGSDMVLTDNDGGNQTSTVSFADLEGGIVATVMVGGNPDGTNPYTITVTNVSGSTQYWTYSNYTLDPIQQVNMFLTGETVGGSNNDEFFNDLQITPEPGSLALFAMGGIGLMLRRRKSA